jgi:hypothetical protein
MALGRDNSVDFIWAPQKTSQNYMHIHVVVNCDLVIEHGYYLVSLDDIHNLLW